MVADEYAGVGSSQGRGHEDRRCQSPVGLRFPFGDTELLEQDMAMGPSQVEYSVGQIGIVISFGQDFDARSRIGNPRDDIDGDRFIGLQGDGLPNRDHGIEHRSGGVGKSGQRIKSLR